jgi:hypothetical protein
MMGGGGWPGWVMGKAHQLANPIWELVNARMVGNHIIAQANIILVHNTCLQASAACIFETLGVLAEIIRIAGQPLIIVRVITVLKAIFLYGDFLTFIKTNDGLKSMV